jgi:uncharacterized protein YjbI with pentapeptide repeats
MANKEALRMLKAGREAWRRWHDRKREEVSAPREGVWVRGVSGVTVDGRIDLAGADLSALDLTGFDLSRVAFSYANLSSSRLVNTDLTHSSLYNANVAHAKLYGANLTFADCRGADFRDSALYHAHCFFTDFSGASLQRTELRSAVFASSKMNAADLSDSWVGSNIWAEVDFRGVKGLANVIHTHASTIGLDTVLASAGEIPETFLRGCGLPDTVIAYISSLAGGEKPIELYSCFISHSTIDGEFCKQLHNDLQAAGVRCWFAPEDLKMGDRFRDEIETAIRLHDKLLLVLSESSVQSDWVRSEVESAFERESRERKQVLFPVRLDEAVMDTAKAWAADIRRQRHIGNFSLWKDHEFYKRAFDRLLRDLRAVPNA